MKSAVVFEATGPARAKGKPVGHVTGAIWSPRLEKNIGYVWVPTALSQPGTQLEVQMPDGTATGRTAAIPFIDPKKRTPAGIAARGNNARWQ